MRTKLKMKPHRVVLLLTGGLLCGAGPAEAHDGQVRFTGALTTASCVVDPADSNQVVQLGNIPSAQFSASGDKSPARDFNIDLTECPASIGSVLAKFDGVSDPVNASLLGLDKYSGATSVAVEIAEKDGTPVPLHNASRDVTVDATTHAATLSFLARYVATASSVGVGTAVATSQFTLNYN